MRIIHCADLHLDSPLHTNLSDRMAEERNTEILRTFVRMTQYARKNGVGLVLIAGDLFDGERVKRRTVDGILEAVKAAPEVEFLYLPGNHDNTAHAFFDCPLPENLKCFSDTWTSYSYEDVSVSGIVITEHNAEALYDSLPRADGKVNLVLLHGQVGTASGVDQVNLKLLQGKGIDYLALGHIHSYALERLDSHGWYCYPGCLEGRGFDECGAKGFVLLEVERGRVQPRFVPFSTRSLHRVSVDVTGLSGNGEILRRMEAAAADIPAGDMVEFVLTGASDPQVDVSAKYLQRSLCSEFYVIRVKDQSRMALDPKDYQNDVSLKGAFIRLVMAEAEDDAEKAAIIRAGIAALAGEEIML